MKLDQAKLKLEAVQWLIKEFGAYNPKAQEHLLNTYLKALDGPTVAGLLDKIQELESKSNNLKNVVDNLSK